MQGSQITLESFAERNTTESEKGRTEATSMGVEQSVDEKTTYDDLIPLVIADDNIDEALKVVVGNREAPGMDGMSVHELEQWVDTNRQKFIESEWLSVRERCTNRRVPNVMHGGGKGQPTA